MTVNSCPEPAPLRRIPANEARIEPAFAPAKILRKESLDAVRMRDEATAALASAHRKLAEANLEAKRILDEARANAIGIEDVARREAATATKAGYDAGVHAAQEAAQALLARIQAAEDQRRAAFPKLVRDVAFRFASAIVDIEFTVRPERVIELVAAALERAGESEVIVELSAADHALIGADPSAFESRSATRIARVRVAPDLVDRQVRIVSRSGGRWIVGVDTALTDLRQYIERTLQTSGGELT